MTHRARVAVDEASNELAAIRHHIDRVGLLAQRDRAKVAALGALRARVSVVGDMASSGVHSGGQDRCEKRLLRGHQLRVSEMRDELSPFPV